MVLQKRHDTPNEDMNTEDWIWFCKKKTRMLKSVLSLSSPPVSTPETSSASLCKITAEISKWVNFLQYTTYMHSFLSPHHRSGSSLSQQEKKTDRKPSSCFMFAWVTVDVVLVIVSTHLSIYFFILRILFHI